MSLYGGEDKCFLGCYMTMQSYFSSSRWGLFILNGTYQPDCMVITLKITV